MPRSAVGLPNKNYKQGYRYEAREVDYQRTPGWYAHRNYGSKGDFDVVSTNGKVTRFISVKSYRKRKGSYKRDLERLAKIPRGPAVERLLVIYGPIKRGVKTPRTVIRVE